MLKCSVTFPGELDFKDDSMFAHVLQFLRLIPESTTERCVSRLQVSSLMPRLK